MINNDWMLKSLLFLIVLLLGMIALQSHPPTIETGHAQTAKFDHVTVVSPLFLHRGNGDYCRLTRGTGTYGSCRKKAAPILIRNSYCEFRSSSLTVSLGRVT